MGWTNLVGQMLYPTNSSGLLTFPKVPYPLPLINSQDKSENTLIAKESLVAMKSNFCGKSGREWEEWCMKHEHGKSKAYLHSADMIHAGSRPCQCKQQCACIVYY